MSQKYHPPKNRGIVTFTHHPLARVKGLDDASLEEIVVFENGEIGQVFLIDEFTADVLMFSKLEVPVGSYLESSGEFLSIPVGEELLGHTITPLGIPILKKDKFKHPKDYIKIDKKILGIDKRKRISKPLFTGITLVDLMIPLGKGQKELIVGDRDTGKTTFLLTTLKTQVESGSIGIYAAIGKSQYEIKKVTDFLEEQKIFDKVIVVATSSDDSPGLIYLTPYAAISIAEYFLDLKKDVVVILDDLSTHAKYYREISLISGRFPGRDSYPGDIFYIHARLLERAGTFKTTDGGEVSLTILPVAEVVEGDLAGFIPTNLMGMTDGHIYFDANEFYKGKRPAINIPLSVTRVGRQAQTPLFREINRYLMSFLSTFTRLEELSHLGAELSEDGRRNLRIGESIIKLFNQPSGLTVPIEVQLLMIGLLWNEFLETSATKLSKYRETLIKNFHKNAQLKSQITDILNCDSFERFIDKVYQNHDKLMPYVK